MILKIISGVNVTCGVLFFICYALQLFYTFLTVIKKPRTFPDAPKTKRYAILIAARNEEAVIGYLLDSIRQQDYPSQLVQSYVVADNCTDSTAAVARAHGATVYERQDQTRIGKGYALHFLLDEVMKEKGENYYDAYIVIDADNVLDSHYVTEMNKCFSAGYRCITSYRNSKNYGDNWISAGSSLWFLREARQLNAARSLLGTSCAISGTGFLVSRELILEQGGWQHFCIIEDIEFTVDKVSKGEVIGYCHDAILYDEQPTTFRQSWRQHLRWARGYWQVLRRYGLQLLKGLLKGPHLACYDMIMVICPAYFLTLLGTTANLLSLLYIAFFGASADFWLTLLRFLAEMYLMTFAVGLIAVITEWKRIHCKAYKKILYSLTFPLFMATYIPESLVAIFTKPNWKPIYHKAKMNLKDIENQ